MKVRQVKRTAPATQSECVLIFLTDTLVHAATLWDEGSVVSAVGSFLGGCMADRDEQASQEFLQNFANGVMFARAENLKQQQAAARDANQVC